MLKRHTKALVMTAKTPAEKLMVKLLTDRFLTTFRGLTDTRNPGVIPAKVLAQHFNTN